MAKAWCFCRPAEVESSRASLTAGCLRLLMGSMCVVFAGSVDMEGLYGGEGEGSRRLEAGTCATC